MKKKGKFLISLVLFILPFLLPNNVLASNLGIKTFQMDATIEINGDVTVKELISLNGDYNGFDRIITYRNARAPKFTGDIASFGGGDIYNADSLLINKIGAVDKESTLDNLANIDLFNTINTGTNYGYYEEIKNTNINKYHIYNPSSYNNAFYLEYILKNMAIVHNDVAEIGFNIFTDELVEDIEDFSLVLHIPNNKKQLKAWAHGPLNGNIEIIDNQTVKVTISKVNSKTPMDVRMVFDKDSIGLSTKFSNIMGLDKILAYEKVQATNANELRKQARILYYGSYILGLVWLCCLVAIIIYAYLSYDKEYKSSFAIEYYRELPNTYGPAVVGYLFHKKIGTTELSATILNLIYKKIIKVDEIQAKDKKDYKFTYMNDKVLENNISECEASVIGWLFNEANEVLLSEFETSGNKNYSAFLKSYDSFKNMATEEALTYQFYEEKKAKIGFIIGYCILGLFLGYGIITIADNFIWGVVILVLAVLAILYLSTITKRTMFGNDEYTKWKAFKKFLKDFGNFEKKDLPEIFLWEQYLVYAVVLGCADKLAEIMKIKGSEYYPEYDNGYSNSAYNFYYMMSFNRIINQSVNSTVNRAMQSRAAAYSSNSSASGTGGGFSSGGGTFGGGGGGGRF